MYPDIYKTSNTQKQFIILCSEGSKISKSECLISHGPYILLGRYVKHYFVGGHTDYNTKGNSIYWNNGP